MSQGYSNDLAVIKSIKNGALKQNILLFPQNQMQPDGLWLMHENNKWFAVVFAQIISSNEIDKKTFEQNERSTDISLVYYKADGSGVNEAFQSMCESFHHLTDEAFRNNPTKLGGVLRIHVLLPSVVNTCSAEKPTVHSTQQEVKIHITKTNVQSLFPDSNTRQVLSQATHTIL